MKFVTALGSAMLLYGVLQSFIRKSLRTEDTQDLAEIILLFEGSSS